MIEIQDQDEDLYHKGLTIASGNDNGWLVNAFSAIPAPRLSTG